LKHEIEIEIELRRVCHGVARRIYAPTAAYFDKTWPLGDFEKLK